MTILARTDGHRALTTAGVLSAAGGQVAVVAGDGCGSTPTCGLADGDIVLVVSPGNACALFRIADAGEPPTLTA